MEEGIKINSSLKTKWVSAANIEEIERVVNEFCNNHIVKATQTHCTFITDKIIYTAVIFYRSDEQSQ